MAPSVAESALQISVYDSLADRENQCNTSDSSSQHPSPVQVTINAPTVDIVSKAQTEYEMATLAPMATGDFQSQPENPRSKLRLLAVMTALFLALFIGALDATIVATAIPTISSELRSASGYTWIGGAYLLANAAAAPIWAKLSDIWGRKLILLAAVALFSPARFYVPWRRGTAAGGLIQMVHITISDLFSLRSRSLYLGLLECMWAVAGGVGPVLGGVLTQYASWRWIFWINLPVTGLTFVLLGVFLDVHNPRTGFAEGMKAIDWFGSFSILALTLMLLLGLNFGGVTFPWSSPKVICLVVFGTLMSVFFVYSEKRLARYPIMPLRLFHHRSNIASLLVCVFQGFVGIGGEYYLPLYFQSVQGASPLRSGLLVLPVTVTGALMGITVGVIIHRTGRYLELMWVGTALLTIGNGLYIYLSTSSTIVQIVIFELIVGLGAGLLFEPPLISIQAIVSQADTATATSTLSFFRSLAEALSVVIGGVVFQNGMKMQAPALVASGLSANLTQAFSGGDAAANVMLVATIMDPIQRGVVKEAFALSLKHMWILYTCVSAGGVIASAFIGRQVLSKIHVETKTGIKE